jgi:hypothetical protein
MSILTGDNPFYKIQEAKSFNYPKEDARKLADTLKHTKTFTVVTAKPAKDWAIHWYEESNMGRMTPKMWFDLPDMGIAKKAGLGDHKKLADGFEITCTSKGMEVSFSNDHRISDLISKMDGDSIEKTSGLTSKDLDKYLDLVSKHMAKYLNDWVNNFDENDHDYDEFYDAFGGVDGLEKAKFTVK